VSYNGTKYSPWAELAAGRDNKTPVVHAPQVDAAYTITVTDGIPCTIRAPGDLI